MSGQPNKTENDIIRHKNEYIESLNLQTTINKQNYDANKLYKETGQVMPIIALTDNRSIEDKLLDTEKLKQDIAKSIGTISSLTFGTEVVNAILQNPLNINNSLLIFTAQRINEIILNLKKIYAIGIKGDKNDVQQLLNFIVKMYTDANAFTRTAKNFIDVQPTGSLTPAGNPSLDNQIKLKQTIDNILPQLGQQMDFFYNDLIVGNAGLFRPQEQRIINSFNEIARLFPLVFGTMEVLSALVLTPNQIDQLVNIGKRINLPNPNNNQIIEDARDILEIYSKIFPQPNSLITFYTKNKKYINLLLGPLNEFIDEININGYNGPYFHSKENALNTALDKVVEVLINFLGILCPDSEFDLNGLIGFNQNRMAFFNANGIQAQAQVPVQAPVQAQVPVQAPAPAPPVGGPAPPQPPPAGGAGGAPAGQMANQQQWDNYVLQHVIGLSDVQLNALYFAIPNTPYLLHVAPLVGQGMFGNANASRNDKEQACILALRLQYNNPAYSPQTGIGNIVQGAVGLGITKRRRGRPKGNGIMKPYSETVKQNLDLTRGIEPTGKFIKFGKYLLNSHKLNKENIFSLKHISGGNIIDIPSTRLTEDLGKVIKTIVGGGHPHFNDLNKLSETEQNYLHKVCSKSNIIDKLSIPTPSKDAEEKEIHKFEVMKGEIASGNDSPELIKDFKRMILKLQKNNSLPKKEVYEILEELNSLGY
jgi:hypothetical protein